MTQQAQQQFPSPKHLKFVWKNKYIFWGLGAVAVTYTTVHLIKQSRLLDKTCFKPVSFVPNKLSLNEADINIKLNMKNKSTIDYYIKNQVYNVYINDHFVGVIKNPNKIYIGPEKTTGIWLNIKFNPMHVSNISWETLKDLILNKSDVKIKLKGNAKVTTGEGLFSFNYPVDSSFTLKELTAPSSEPC